MSRSGSLTYRKGLLLLGIAVLIAVAWVVYGIWSFPHKTGLQAERDAMLSVVPIAASLVLSVWGIVVIGRVALERRSARLRKA